VAFSSRISGWLRIICYNGIMTKQQINQLERIDRKPLTWYCYYFLRDLLVIEFGSELNGMRESKIGRYQIYPDGCILTIITC